MDGMEIIMNKLALNETCYDTRHPGTYVPLRYKSEQASNSVLSRCIKVWNSIPDPVKNCNNIILFNVLARKHLYDSNEPQ